MDTSNEAGTQAARGTAVRGAAGSDDLDMDLSSKGSAEQKAAQKKKLVDTSESAGPAKVVSSFTHSLELRIFFNYTVGPGLPMVIVRMLCKNAVNSTEPYGALALVSGSFPDLG